MPFYGEPIKYNAELAQELIDYEVLRQSFSRMVFMQPAVDIYGLQDPEYSFYETCHVKKPCLTLKNYKIYECPWSAHLNNFCDFAGIDIPEIEGDDYLNLHTVTLEELEEWCYKPKNRCRYCKLGAPWTWHPSSRSIEEWTWDLYDYYVNRYDEYLYKINYNKSFLNKFLRDLDDPVYLPNMTKMLYARYFGKLDIIIPYYKIDLPLVDRLIESLQMQTIINDCMIYIISDGAPMERFVIEKFKQSGLNFVYLKNKINSGAGVARNHGIEQSHNPYLYFFDMDDYFIRDDALEVAYENLKNRNLDAFFVLKEAAFGDNQIHVHDLSVKREFLNRLDLKYRPVYCHEDDIMSAITQLYGCFDRTADAYSIYTRDNSCTTNKDKSDVELLISKLLSQYYIFNKIDKLNEQGFKFDDGCLEHFLIDFFDFETSLNNYIIQKEKLKEIIVFYYAIAVNIYDHFSSFIKRISSPTKQMAYWVNQIQNSDYFFKINDRITINSKLELKNYFYEFLNSFPTKNKVFYSIQTELKEENT